MTTRVVGTHEVSLNGVRLPIVGKVQSSIANVYGTPPVSRIEWDDQTLGQGLHRITNRFDPTQLRHCFDTVWYTRNPGHLTLGGVHGAHTASGISGIPLLSELDGLLVGSFGTAINSWTSDAWTSRGTVGGTPTDVKNGNLNGTEFLVFAFTTGYSYADAVATWADETVNVVKLEFWDERMWGIDASGQLWYTFDINPTAVTNDAQLLLSHGETVTGLIRSRAPNGRHILYAVTNLGLYAHDLGNTKFVKVEAIRLTDNNPMIHSKVAENFQDRLYLANGRGIKEYDAIAGTVRDMGFDMDDGLPPGRDGFVSCLEASSKELFAGTKEAKAGTDEAVIMAWDRRGWRRFFGDPNGTTIIESMHLANLPGSALPDSSGGDFEHLWQGTTSFVRHSLTNSSSTRPQNINTYRFSALGGLDDKHLYPTFSVPADKIGIALRLRVEVTGVSSSLGVKVYVAFDGGSQTQMTNPEFTTDSTFDATNDRIEGNGTTTFRFPTGATNNAGTQFRDVQIVLEGVGTSGANTPDVLKVTLEFLEVEDVKKSWNFELDFTKRWGGKSKKQLRAAFVTALELKTLPEFTFRDDDGNARNDFVKIMGGGGAELTGHEEGGTLLVRAESI